MRHVTLPRAGTDAPSHATGPLLVRVWPSHIAVAVNVAPSMLMG
jgi:hypothetical protein